MIFKLLIRNLLKRPSLNLIKLTGLVLALSSLILISLYLRYEMSFDRSHPSSERMYRFTASSPSAFSGKHFARIWGASYIPPMAENFPGIESYVRLSPVGGGIIQWEEKKLTLHQAFHCDSTFFSLFNAPLLLGHPEQVLAEPSSMVLSASMARKFFGEADPLGHVLTLPAGRVRGEDQNYTVTGVMEDFPGNSHLHPEFIASPPQAEHLDGWAWTYLLLKENANPVDIEAGFPEFMAEYSQQDVEDIDLSAHLQSITDIHLHSQKTREIESNGHIFVVYSFALAALILLFIALINYFNLNLGMLGYSDRFMFVSRVYGASRRKQLQYYIAEGLILTSLALILSLLIVKLGAVEIKGRFNIDLLGGQFWFVALLAFTTGVLVFLAGFLPQVQGYFSNVLSMTKDVSGSIVRKRRVNRSLIVLQNTIAIILIVAVAVIHRQTAYALQHSLGSDNEEILCLPGVHSDIIQKFPEFKAELLKLQSISKVSAMFEKPGGDANDLFPFSMTDYEPGEEEGERPNIGIFPCDPSFPRLFGLSFIAGDDFSELPEDAEGSGEYIINRAAVERLQHQDPQSIIGKEFQLFFHNDLITIPAGRITGVVEDFHLSSLKREIEALVLFKRKDLWIENLVISYDPTMRPQALEDIERTWEDIFPGYPFQYDFVDAIYEKLYLSERLQATLLLIFTLIALFIGSMGLLGLSLLHTRQKTKEIGIRVVNGATVPSIVKMLNIDFLKWILLACVLALPLAWLAMKRWLQDFAYKTELSWWILALSGLFALLIAGTTISYHVWKAARRNPVEALRHE